MNDFSANEFEKRALIGMAPVQADGSFRIKVPGQHADQLRHARPEPAAASWSSAPTSTCGRARSSTVRRLPRGPRRRRTGGRPIPNPMAAMLPAHDLNVPRANFTVINYQQTIGPIVAAKCVSCHQPTDRSAPDTDRGGRQSRSHRGARHDRDEPHLPARLRQPVGRIDDGGRQVVTPGFPRRSLLIDYVLGLGSRAGAGLASRRAPTR